MLWLVALVAIFNLALGYALATFLNAGHGQLAMSTGDVLDDTESADLDY